MGSSADAGFNIVDAFVSMALLGSSWVLWLLVLLSIVSVAVMLERFVFFKSAGSHFADFQTKLATLLTEKKFEQALLYCEASHQIEARVAAEGLKARELGLAAMEQLMGAQMIKQKQAFDKGLGILGTLGNNAPFIGLFGTVIGIIVAFHELGMNPAGGPSVVMAGISEALVATAVGLIVAIPAVIAFNVFQRLIRKKMANAETTLKTILARCT